MSRSNYSDDIDAWELIRWRGAVKSAIRGKRGQALLKEMLEALDALPEKRLTADVLRSEDDDVCALGAVAAKRGIDVSKLDPEEYESVSMVFGIAEALAREIVYENDEGGWRETCEERFERMRKWVIKNIETKDGAK